MTPPSEPPFARIGVVGLGLVGGSVALCARARWPGVQLVGLDDRAITSAAQTRGIIDEAAATLDALGTCDLVVLATPVPAILDLVAHAGRLHWSMAVTDVGSTKRAIVSAAARAGLDGFIGGHPMAGKEQSGLPHAEAGLFEGRPWFLDAARADSPSYPRVCRWVEDLGARPVPIEAAAHDRTMAYVSHLPQWIATNLMARSGEVLGREGLSRAGRAFDDVTRVAGSPASVWEGIFATNADFIAEAAGALARDVHLSESDLTDAGIVRRRFDVARHWRDELRQSRETDRHS